MAWKILQRPPIRRPTTPPERRRWGRARAARVGVLLTVLVCGAAQAAAAAGGVVAGEVAAPGAPGASAKGMPNAQQVLQLLDHTAAWYRTGSAQQQIVTEPADLVALSDSQPIADEAVRAAFDFARAAAALIGPGPDRNSQIADAGRYQGLGQLQQRLDQQLQSVRTQLSGVHSRLTGSTGATRGALESQLTALQAEEALLQARGDAVQQLLSFLSSAVNGTGGTGLSGQIETLADSLAPERQDAAHGLTGGSAAAAGRPAAPQLAPSASASTGAGASNGLWDLSARLLALSGKLGRIDQFRRQTADLAQSVNGIRAGLLQALRAESDQGDRLIDAVGTPGVAPLDAQRSQLDALTAQFKSLTLSLVPLAKLGVLLDQYDTELANWRDGVHREYGETLRSLGVRVGILAIILALVFAASELWRRAAHHYVRDPRRRYQMLLLRRLALWFVVAVVLASTLASRLDSIVTFAGLITAGIAVAMQNVILSVVGYFFLIGKYGVRVGDRVQIGEVSGEVIDIGLVRMHLMEFGRDGRSPTGRVVAFSNSIVFQASGGLFKQIPGVHVGWHEITVTLVATAEAAAVRRRLLAAVDTALAEHREDIERQHRELERAAFAPSERALRPSVSLKFALSGVEATVRYPVDLRYAAEIDEAVSRELLAVLSQSQRKEGTQGTAGTGAATATAAAAAAGAAAGAVGAAASQEPESGLAQIRINPAAPS